MALDLRAPPLPPGLHSNPTPQSADPTKKKIRHFPPEALFILQAAWREDNSPKMARRLELRVPGEEDCNERRVYFWFRNKRRTQKKHSELAPVYLPPFVPPNARYPSLTAEMLGKLLGAWECIPEGSHDSMRYHWIHDAWPQERNTREGNNPLPTEDDIRRWLDDKKAGITKTTPDQDDEDEEEEMEVDSDDEDDLPLAQRFPPRRVSQSLYDDDYEPIASPISVETPLIRRPSDSYFPPTPTSTRAPSLAIKSESDTPVARYSSLPIIETLPYQSSSSSSSYSSQALYSPPPSDGPESRASTVFSARQIESPIISARPTIQTQASSSSFADNTPPPDIDPRPRRPATSSTSTSTSTTPRPSLPRRLPPRAPPPPSNDTERHLLAVYEAIKQDPPGPGALTPSAFDVLWQEHNAEERMTQFLAEFRRGIERI
ncbi:hypothetical protein MIND_01389700 [Mycena indigotica]|uniref:Homeobox domain-containing protein n=1 Tax=Mycena indigotica TaxID=2126181 RepID=A0A8H6RYG7_9AGAR|nr:uncharacterized protein MIND_01389700 [Mycena indigotica]KAF7289281.1 hypothetical protein MIND_01389700 [Mycena indigotica]